MSIKLQHSQFPARAAGREAKPCACASLLSRAFNYQRSLWKVFAGPSLFQRWSSAVRLRNNLHLLWPFSDKSDVKLSVPDQSRNRATIIPWAMRMKAVSTEEPSRLVQSLTGAILGCGGWVLSRGANDSGAVNLLFEFERHACIDIYTMLIAAGVELSQSGHIRFTELCQCTRSQPSDRGAEIASVDLEIQTFPAEIVSVLQASGPV